MQAIASDDLSMQWDVGQEVLVLEGYFKDRQQLNGGTKFGADEAKGHHTATVDLGRQFWYGSPTDEYRVPPRNMGVLCGVTVGIGPRPAAAHKSVLLPANEIRRILAVVCHGAHVTAETVLRCINNKVLIMDGSNQKSHGLFGTWKLISNRIRMEDTGEELDLLGTNPRGVITFAPTGRMIALLTTAERPTPTATQTAGQLLWG